MNTVVKAKRSAKIPADDALVGVAEALVSRVPKLGPDDTVSLLNALRDLLEGSDELAKRSRKGMQLYLIDAAEDQGRPRAKTVSKVLLTTEEAADLMQCSRPYVTMLIDNKKLDGAMRTQGGHRRVPEASVRAWIKQREIKSQNSDYRGAAEESGMYEIPDSAFQKKRAGKS